MPFQPRELHNSLTVQPGFAPVVLTDNTATSTAWIDRRGYGALEFVLCTGTLADSDATFAVTMSEADESNQSDAAAPSSDVLIGTAAEASFTFAADAATRKIGYIGGKRYVRLTVTPSGNTGNAPLACVAILGRPQSPS